MFRRYTLELIAQIAHSALLMVCCLAFLPSNGFCQFDETQTFELRAPGLDKPSVARLSDSELVIRDPSGNTTIYKRLSRYDTEDGAWIGYSSKEAKQVIRWPTSARGPMQIGTLRNGRIEFTTSRMNVHANEVGLGADGMPRQFQDVLPDTGIETSGLPLQLRTPSEVDRPAMLESSGNLLGLPQMTPMHFGVGPTNQRQYLSVRDRSRFGLSNDMNDAMSAWYMAPVGNEMFRLQQRVGDRWLAVGLDANMLGNSGLRGGNPPGASFGGGGRPRGASFGGGGFPPGASFGGGNAFRGAGSMPLGLHPIGGGCEQLWRVNPYQGGYFFENVMFPGMGLSWLPTGGIGLTPISYDPWQIWYPQQPVISLPPPQFRTSQQQFVANQPLPPINVNLTNTHRDELLVLLADRRVPQTPQKIRIPAGRSQVVRLDRDAGGTIVETVEVLDSFGNWTQQQYTTPVPPTVLYDMSVYEIFLQSIAIDRTGKSPNPIEDINMQPRSIGFFLVPPGDMLVADSVIDAYRVAEDAKNPGAVRRLSERDLKGPQESNQPDPLKAILQQFQKQRAAF
jgi:hypothetical protein